MAWCAARADVWVNYRQGLCLVRSPHRAGNVGFVDFRSEETALRGSRLLGRDLFLRRLQVRIKPVGDNGHVLEKVGPAVGCALLDDELGLYARGLELIQDQLGLLDG